MLPSAHSTEAQWEAELTTALGYEVRVEFTRARCTPIQLRHATRAELSRRPQLKQGWVVRLHQIFMEAPPPIRANLASWIRVGRRAPRACRELSAWTEESLRALPAPSPRKIRVQPRGEIHDLVALAEELCEGELRGEFSPARPVPGLSWGKRGKSRARRSLQLGSYNVGQDMVRIHSVLDHAHVPSWFVRYVLFHEHLHALIPSERSPGNNRLLHHGPRFVARERKYADYDRALKWQKRHLPRLLRRARRG